jgi:hypothetical protein
MPAVEAPSASVRDASEFLDVLVQQVAGPFVLVAADGLTGGAVDLGQPVDPAPLQDGVHGARRGPDDAGDPDRTEAALPADVDDLAEQWLWGAGRTAQRP